MLPICMRPSQLADGVRAGRSAGVWRLAGSEQTGGVSDHYAEGTYRWWHLSVPSPELHQALAEGWLPLSGLALDVGCGLGTEAAHLHRLGWRVIGVDLSPVALAGATRRNHGPGYLQADLLRLPLRSSAFDACLDRGCFHYLPARYRPGYAAELRRVLRPGGKLLLRASVILTTFAEWRVEHMQRTKIPSDTRSLDVLLVRLAA
jgi:SAM-dependent methyltransferase